MVKRPGGAMIPNNSDPSLTNSVLIPIVNKWSQISRPGLILPVLASAGAWVVLDNCNNAPIEMLKGGIGNLKRPLYISSYMLVLALYLTAAIFYVTYRLCRRRKMVLLLVAMAVFTGGVMLTPLFDYFVFMFGSVNLANAQWLSVFISVGLKEELVKAAPVLVLFWLAPHLKTPWRARLGVCDPLDGILLATASAAGFALVETLVDYVSWQQIIDPLGKHFFEQTLTAGAKPTVELYLKFLRELATSGSSALNITADQFWEYARDRADGNGLILLVNRVLSEGFGHLAYSGYFGYFIGLAALRPQRMWQLLGIGWASSALMHTLWDTNDSPQVVFVIAVVSYLVLVAAILKARDLSYIPLYSGSSVVVGKQAPIAPVVTPQAQRAEAPATREAAGAVDPPRIQPREAAHSPAIPVQPLWLVSGRITVQPAVGMKFVEQQVSGLRAQADGIVAEVRRHPNDVSKMGLTNLSTAVWRTTSQRGNTHEVRPGQSVVLEKGTKIDFGGQQAEVLDAPPAPAPAVVAAVATRAGIELRIGQQAYPLTDDATLLESQLPGLKALFPDGVVARIGRNREDSSTLELKNVSGSVWHVLVPGRERERISAGETVALLSGTKISFGSVDGEVI